MEPTGWQVLTRCSAHVRATTAGTLSLDNCHPFQFNQLMVRARILHASPRLTARVQWMHNGELAGFIKYKRRLQASVPDEIYEKVLGNTGQRCVFGG
jgi:predicted glutamine amidotransferase